MWEKIIRYFSKKHLLVNFFVILVIIGGIYFWHETGKEAMPDLTLDRIRVSISYPDASPEDVEHFVTRPAEEALRGINGIYRVSSRTGAGSTRITIELEPNYLYKEETKNDITTEIMNVNFPDEVEDDPRIKEYKTSERAIIDLGIVNKNIHLLDKKSRYELQKYVRLIEDKLESLPQISEVSASAYQEEEIQIRVNTAKLKEYNISFNEIIDAIGKNNIRQPAGTIKGDNEIKVSLQAELDEIEEIENVIIQGDFSGSIVRIKDLAKVEHTFDEDKFILKVNGHEGVRLKIVKSSSYDILSSIAAIKEALGEMQNTILKESPIELYLLDDESWEIRNRLSLIGMNGAIGFVFIIIFLLIFLDLRSAIWVSFGIPFAFCISLIMVYLFGFTINNMTLAAVIIVMGMIVDDAIVVAENVSRLKATGLSQEEAVVQGTEYVILPIIASILTTCVAFIPLYFISGRFGKFVYFIPPIIFMMLGASLFEAIFVLPSHLSLKKPKFLIKIQNVMLSIRKKIYKEKPKKETKIEKTGVKKLHWFLKIENIYEKVLEKLLKHKIIVFAVFAALLLVSFFLLEKMEYVMFPREETVELRLKIETPKGTDRIATAEVTREIEEKVLFPYFGKEITSIRTDIAKNRSGRPVQEHKAQFRIEIVPKQDRSMSTKQLMKEWQKGLSKIENLEVAKFRKKRFGGQDSSVEIIVLENNETIRRKAVQKLHKEMLKYDDIKDVEVDEPDLLNEFKIDINREVLSRLNIDPSDIARTLQTILSGKTVYKITSEEEEIKVIVTAHPDEKNNIAKVLDIPVENRNGYLVPLRKVITTKGLTTPDSIERVDFKRKSMIYADINEKKKTTPLQVARYLEANIFPKVIEKYPTIQLKFDGEVHETIKSGDDLKSAILMAILFIYIILALLFNSLFKPFIIMLSIPFGVVGIIIAFYFHGISIFGFFSVIGAIGLAGVVVNDSIIMLVKLEKEMTRESKKINLDSKIAAIAKTRLRAVLLTTLTTVAGLLPTAYGLAGYDSMLAEMMLAMAWGLMFGTAITLILIPSTYSILTRVHDYFHKERHNNA